MTNNYLNTIESYKDFPKEGVVYWDFTPLHEDPELFKKAIDEVLSQFKDKKVTRVAAIEAKGFILGTALATSMQLPLSLIRKPGLIPGEVLGESFVKEYGQGSYQLKNKSLQDEKVLLVYDILAGPGATQAAIRLLKRAGATVVGCAYVIELAYLHGREELEGYDVFSLVTIKQKRL